MATCNGERFVGEQIASLQLQTHREWRLLASDDRSDDGTAEAVRRAASVDPRVRVVPGPERRGGAKRNFMGLLALSDAPYAMFCDQDDVWLPEKVERTLSRMRDLEASNGEGEPLLVFSDMAVVDEGLGLIAPSFTRYSNLNPRRCSLTQVLGQAIGAGCSFMMNRPLIELARECADADAIVMHDWWVTLVAAAFGSISYIDEPLALYRQHGGNAIGASAFTPGAWLGRTADMRASQERIARQAACFADTFAGGAPQSALVAARECALTVAGTPVQNVIALAKSGAWKAGSRKFGQLAAAISSRGGGCRHHCDA